MPEEQFVMFGTIGGETVTVRGKHYVEPRGYAGFPGNGPEGHTCGDCCFKEKRRRWLKCSHEFARRKHTHGRGTDILARSPACQYWQAMEDDIVPDLPLAQRDQVWTCLACDSINGAEAWPACVWCQAKYPEGGFATG